MTPVLGLSVSGGHVRAVLWWRGAIQWAGAAPYTSAGDLADAIARLAGEAGLPVRRARVVLERDIVQLRSIVPAPPLKPRALRRYVALEAPRLFRQNGVPLVTDGARVRVMKEVVALWAGAAAEPLAQAVLAGCAQAGLALEALGPAADVLPRAVSEAAGPLVFPNGATTEVLEVGPEGTWQSRLVARATDQQASTLDSVLEGVGPDAPHFAAAYAAALALPRLALLPSEAQAARERHTRRRLLRLVALGAALWALAAGAYVARLAWTRHIATRSLGGAAAAVDSALTVRRQLALARATLATVADAEQRRSRHLALLAAVTRALGDSTHLVALQVTAEGTVRFAGYAPVAARVVADLEGVALIRDVRLEGPVTRETLKDAAGNGIRQVRDRFAIVARLEVSP